MNIDWESLESKWRKKWEEACIFEADPDTTRLKYFLTVAYPYPNSPQHIGHGRTYTLADVHARHMRMLGYTVLFPMAFHYTGTPILAMWRRLQEGDEDLIDTFTHIYEVELDVLKDFTEPVKIARYFHEEIKQGMKEIGYSIDWRREFTTIDSHYKHFIEWQFRRLYGKGLITQGSHPVGWCPNDGNPVGQHDTLGDVEPEIGEYVVIKFPMEDYSLPTATLRPETVFGVTNIWVNPDVIHVKAVVDGEKWIVTPECVEKLRYLNRRVEEEERMEGSSLIGKCAENPATGASLPILPASFVDPANGTGIVMSVPAHAPYDYQALEDLAKSLETLSRYAVDSSMLQDLVPISIIESEGYSEIPALDEIRRRGIKDQSDQRLEDATSELYGHEFHMGRMKDNTKQYAGLPVSKARDEVKMDLMAAGKANTIFEIMNKPVVCRCGTTCVVKIFQNQWFINYGAPEWKSMAYDCLKGMSILPEEIRPEFEYTIGWLRQKACARKSGLGTPLPWDKDWIIESLSDSVIYMAYYTISKYINRDALRAEQFTDEVFDHIFLGEGNVNVVAEKVGINVETLGRMQKEFQYFYPLDCRHSGRDLVPNHLTFFIFNHSAIFFPERWPRQIVVNGSVLMDGKKMSKSFGNIIPLRSAVRRYGADPVRLTILATAELLQDADVSIRLVKTFADRLERFHSLVSEVVKLETDTDTPSLQLEDRWLLSRIQRSIISVTQAMTRLRVREAIHHAVYMLDQDIQWYMRRISIQKSSESGSSARVLWDLFDVKVRLLAPFAPHICEEVWEMMGREGFVALEEWPKVDEQKVDVEAEEAEEIVKATLEDTLAIIKVTKIKPKKISLYVSSGWKWHVYLYLLDMGREGPLEVTPVMKSLLLDPEMKKKAKELSAFVQKLVEELRTLPPERKQTRRNIGKLDELKVLGNAKAFYIREFGCELDVHHEDDPQKYDPKGRAKLSRPYRPAIYIE